MLLPLKDYNPLKRISFQYVTVALIATCVGVFLWQMSLDQDDSRRMVLGLGAIPSVLFHERQLPGELVLAPAELTLITSMFMHGGWMHLLGNMLFLWVLGDNVEDATGHLRFVFFYVICGIAAALTHAALNPHSVAPMIGASGAISGVIGAYLVLHPKARILTLVVRFLVPLPAFVILGIWSVLQFFNAAATGAGAEGGGTAWWAHVGGLVAGVVLIVPMRQKHVPLLDGVIPSAAAKRRSKIPDSGRGRR